MFLLLTYICLPIATSLILFRSPEAQTLFCFPEKPILVPQPIDSNRWIISLLTFICFAIFSGVRSFSKPTSLRDDAIFQMPAVERTWHKYHSRLEKCVF